jgi:hydrogenase/urease accessory protein HupE
LVTLGLARVGPIATPGYLLLGVEHILGGIDHLLFVLCLILLVPDLWGLLKTITAFTLAHSLTLALAAFDVVRVPQPPVEATIALSILFLARELARPGGEDGVASRRPWLVAFVFGLLHGFGFASALAQVGLPADDVPLALLLFNAGVEAGQLAFIAAVYPLVLLGRRWRPAGSRWVPALPVYAVGSVAGFWWLQRMAAVIGFT